MRELGGLLGAIAGFVAATVAFNLTAEPVFTPLGIGLEARYGSFLGGILALGTSLFALALWIAIGLGTWAVVRAPFRAMADAHDRGQARIQEQLRLDQARIQEQLRLDQARIQQQLRRERQLEQLISETAAEARGLPHHFSSAVTAVNRAEQDFADGALDPFWDAVEVAIQSLARFDAGLRVVATNTSRYAAEVKKLVTPPPRFTLDSWIFPDARAVSQRLSRLVRQAQRSYEFTSIYKQRRTNELLASGFANLGDAIGQLGDRLEGSIHGLSEGLAAAVTVIEENQSTRADELIGDLRSLHTQIAEHIDDQRRYEEKSLESLDAIRRRRRS